ncbi:hypothetical protein GCM10017688_44920 [Streptomyces ramulosus]
MPLPAVDAPETLARGTQMSQTIVAPPLAPAYLLKDPPQGGLPAPGAMSWHSHLSNVR